MSGDSTATVRTPKRRGYTVIPNGLLPEGKVSARAWGLYAYLLSRPANWEIRTSQLTKVFAEGRDALYVALRQLVELDLMRLESYRNEDGLPRKRYVLIDPEEVLKSPDTDFQDTDYQDTEKPGVTTTDLINPDLTHFGDFSTSEQSSDDKRSCTPQQVEGAPSNPRNLTSPQRKQLRQALQAVGKLLQQGHKFYDDKPQHAWEHFAGLMEETFPNTYDTYQDLIENGKWTVSAAVASPYAAGRELNVLINTANKL